MTLTYIHGTDSIQDGKNHQAHIREYGKPHIYDAEYSQYKADTFYT